MAKHLLSLNLKILRKVLIANEGRIPDHSVEALTSLLNLGEGPREKVTNPYVCVDLKRFST